MIIRFQRLQTGRKLKLSPALPQREHGIALFTTLLLLSLVSLLALAMMLTVNSDMMINGYYGNFRSSFYAADSGLNVARQALMNNFNASVNMTPCVGWGTGAASGCTTDPLSGTNAGSVLSTVKSSYSSFAAMNPSGSWPGSFEIVDNSSGSTPCVNALAAATGYPQTHVNATSGLIDSYTYRFNYTLCSTGRAQSLQQVMVKESGSLVMMVQAQTTTSQQAQVSFAAFGAFINNYPPCLGPLIPGTMTGPMFTNGAWQFMTGGSYIFTDPVGQANSKADYYFGSNCIQSATSSYTYGGQTIRPTFQGGLNLNQPAVSLPPNSFSQKWAVLDGKGCGEGGTTCGTTAPPAPTNSDLNAHLKNISGTSYPTGGASSGVYLPYCTTGMTGCSAPNTVNGGGIYVEGSANVTMSIGTDSHGNQTQIYSIAQGSTTTTITTNIGANTTTVVSGGTTLNLTGVPENLNGAAASPATMLYVNGNVNSLSGTGQGVPAVQDHSQVTIAANGNVNITGDVIYAHEPVTMNTANTLVSGNDYNQVLGVFTATGNIQLSSPYSNKNLQVDGSLAAIGSSCASNSCGFTVSGSINTFNNVGGQIQGNIFSASMQTENTYFDRRFTSKPGFAPPWFPSTTLPLVDITNAAAPLVTVSQPQRLSWVSYPQ